MRTLVSRVAALLAIPILVAACAATPAHVRTGAHPVFPTGLVRPTGHVAPPSGAGLGATPSSVNLSAWDPPVDTQSIVNSCVSWSSVYYNLDWLLAHDHGIRLSAALAPMSIYPFASGQQNVGTTFEGSFAIEENQGVVPDSVYTPKPSDASGPHAGRYDYQDLPNSADEANAAPYKLTGYRTLFIGANQSGNLQAITGELAAGHPVLVGIPVYDNFEGAGFSYPTLIGLPQGSFYGNHAVMVDGYHTLADGTIVLDFPNSWGTSWGAQGRASLSQAFGQQEIFAAYVLSGITAPAPSPTPTPKPSPTATSTPSPTLLPTTTPTPVPPTPAPTNTPAPAPTSTPTPSPTPVHHKPHHHNHGARRISAWEWEV